MKTLTKPRVPRLRTKTAAHGIRRWSAVDFADPVFKQNFKDTLSELLTENPRIVRDALEDAWEDSSAGQAEFARWISEGEGNREVSMEKIDAILRGGK
jgi:hypothetical protein